MAANVYILVFNVLNTKNITGVYSTTGNPNDDGYLLQHKIKIRSCSRWMHNLSGICMLCHVNSPGNYMLPRRIHVGVQFGF